MTYHVSTRNVRVPLLPEPIVLPPYQRTRAGPPAVCPRSIRVTPSYKARVLYEFPSRGVPVTAKAAPVHGIPRRQTAPCVAPLLPLFRWPSSSRLCYVHPEVARKLTSALEAETDDNVEGGREHAKPQVLGYTHHPHRRKSILIACKDRRCAKKEIKTSNKIPIGGRLLRWKWCTLVHSFINSTMTIVGSPGTTCRFGCKGYRRHPCSINVAKPYLLTGSPGYFLRLLAYLTCFFSGGTTRDVLPSVDGNCTQPSPPRGGMRTPPRATNSERLTEASS